MVSRCGTRRVRPAAVGRPRVRRGEPMKRSVRVLHVLDAQRRPGAALNALDVAARLDAARFSVGVLVCGRGREEVARQGWGGLRMLPAGSEADCGPWGLRRLERMLRIERPDVLHARGRECGWVLVAARRAGVPVVLHSVDAWDDVELRWPAGVRARLAHRLYGHANVVTAASDALRHAVLARTRIAQERTLTLRPGVDVTWFAAAHPVAEVRRALGVAPGAFVCGADARGGPPLEVLRAFARVRTVNPTAVLVLRVPPGVHDELEQLAAAHGCLGAVHASDGTVDDRDHLAALDVAVVAGTSPTAVRDALEASAAGTAVIAQEGRGMGEFVEDGRTGLLVSDLRAESLGDALLRLSSTRLVRERMARAARAHVAARFSIEACVARHDDLYSGLLAQARGPADAASRAASPAAPSSPAPFAR